MTRIVSSPREAHLTAGPGRREDVIAFAGDRAGFKQGASDFHALLDRHPLQPRTRYRCELVFEEVVSNIIRHGYTDNDEHRVSVTVAVDGDRVTLRFEDDGVAFDPRQAAPAPAEAPPDSDLGGRGLALVRSVSERMDYERTPHHRNHLRVTIAAAAI